MKRTVLLAALSAAAAGLYFGLVPSFVSPYTVVLGLLFGAVGGLGVELYLRMRPTLGTLTSAAALSVLAGVLFAAVAAVAPQCPGTTLTARCPVHYVGTWTVVGALGPVLVGALLLPAYLLVRAVLLGRDLATGRRRLGPPATLRAFLVRFGVLPEHPTRGGVRAGAGDGAGGRRRSRPGAPRTASTGSKSTSSAARARPGERVAARRPRRAALGPVEAPAPSTRRGRTAPKGVPTPRRPRTTPHRPS